MVKCSYIPTPYFQFSPDAASYDLTCLYFKTVPNEKIVWHCPFIIIDADLINQPIEDIAIAVAESDEVLATETDADTQSLDSQEPASQAIDAQLTESQDTVAENTGAENTDTDLTSNQAELPQKEAEQPAANTETVNAETADEPALERESGLESKLESEIDPEIDPEIIEQAVNELKQDEKAEEAYNTDKKDEDKELNADKFDEDKDSEAIEDTEKEDAENSTEDSTEVNENSENQEHKDSNDKDEELSEEEKLKQEKEAKLESYKQFVATQKSKIDIDYQGIRVDIEANALPSRMYFIMNALSAIIASYGLVINSAAVVIGAMLVAMMLGPISGVALAIIDYRMPFLRKSLLTVLAGGAMVVSIGFIVGLTHQDTALSEEILSRTQPTSMDLMIALAGGTAGAYAMISPHLSVAVVGVAVATALVPPLAASGILFAHGEGALGLGALLLAITNIIAIQFTNALVLWFSGFRRLMEDDYKTNPLIAFFRRNAVPLLLLAVIGGYLSYNLNNITKKQTFKNEVSKQISSYFADTGNTLTRTQMVTRKDHQTVRAVMQGDTKPTATDIQKIEQQINQNIQENYPNYLPVRVQLRYMPVVVIESSPNNTDEISKTDAALLSID